MPVAKNIKPHFFKKPSEFNTWLKKNHESAEELIVGFYKKASKKPSMTWSESVDEALCYGWIDGITRNIDEESFCIRFTPRRLTSVWSIVNINKVAVLTKEGRMHASGLKAFQARKENKTGIYAFEQKNTDLNPAQLKLFKSHKEAWAFFETQPPSYRKTATWWVISAKQEATRSRRLETLIDDSENGLRLKQLRR
ncbi:MAG: YdeI/OmpD-associated family protein [Bacteroidota bacterium]|nr:YdeI/OmpD-associated family protein [Bacteroidota bacterium]